jgi:hypothetical protein
MKKKALAVLGPVITLVVVGGYLWWQVFRTEKPNHQPRFTISKETTYVNGPIDKEGFVDYTTALNERLGKGITSETNAAVLLWRAHGPHPDESESMPPEFFTWLGIESPPEDGDYFIELRKHLSERGDVNPTLERGRELLKPVLRGAWKADQHPLIADWLKRNEKPLALVIEATKRSHYFNPLVPKRTSKGTLGVISARLPTMQPCREMANALIARSMLNLGTGKAEDAWQDLIACHRLAQMLGRGGCSIELLVGFAINEATLPANLAYVSHAGVSLEQVRRSLDDLKRIPPMATVAEKMDTGERFLFLDIIMNFNRYGITYSEAVGKELIADDSDSQADALLNSIDFDHSLRMGNQLFDDVVTALQERDRTTRRRRLADLHLRLAGQEERLTGKKSLADMIQTSNQSAEEKSRLIGELLSTMFAPGFIRLQASADRLEQRGRNLQLAFALAAYHREIGSYPNQLEVLIPKYLDQLPTDLYSGQKLLYRLTDDGYLLYSVGPNGQDDEERSSEDVPKGDDIRVRMPLPEPQIK